MRRTELRQHAFKIIYQFPFYEDFDPQSAAEYYLSEIPEVTDSDRAYIIGQVGGVLQNSPRGDTLISEHLTGWTIERIGKVDLAILRLSIYEMENLEDVPTGVSINEAVELAKIFGGDDSPSFVNGILGQIALTLKKSGEDK